MVILSDLTQVTDPLALIVAAGGAAIGALSLALWGMLLYRFKGIEERLKSLELNLVGSTGYEARMTRLEGHVQTLQVAVQGTLTEKFFESSTRDQNRRLDELKTQTEELDRKVAKLDRTLIETCVSQAPLPLPPRLPRR